MSQSVCVLVLMWLPIGALAGEPRLVKPYQQGEVERGQQAIVARWEWVRLAKPCDVIPRGAFRGIGAEGVITVLGQDDHRLLVRYNTQRSRPDECPDGAIFFLPESHFKAMPAQYAQRQKEAREWSERAARLKAGVVKDAQPIIYLEGELKPGHQAIVSVTLQVRLAFPSVGEDEDLRIVHEGETLTVLNADEKWVLAQYHALQRRDGQTCTDGALVLLRRDIFCRLTAERLMKEEADRRDARLVERLLAE